MQVEVRVQLKRDVLDPQGEAIKRVLSGLGFTDVGEVRVGKLMVLDVAGDDPAVVKSRVEAACRELLANPVIEDFEVRLP